MQQWRSRLEEKRRPGRPRTRPPKEPKRFGRPKLPAGERVSGNDLSLALAPEVKAWLMIEGKAASGGQGRRGAAEVVRRLIDAADWQATPPEIGPRPDDLPIRPSNEQMEMLMGLAEDLGYQSLSLLIYERAVLPAYLATQIGRKDEERR